MTSVVVTGRGVTTSVGEEVDEMFDALLAGRSGIVDGIGPCSEFDPDPVLTPKGARRTDRFSQLGVAAADKAWAESGLSEDNVDLTRVGVLIGTGVGGLITLENECTKFLEGGERAVSPLFVTMMMPNAARGPDLDADRRARPGLLRRVGMRHRFARDRRGEADHRARRGRRRRRRRLRGGADRAVPGRVQDDGRAVARRHLAPVRRQSRPASSWARARACWSSSARTTPRRAGRRSTAGSPATARRATPTTSRRPTRRAAARLRRSGWRSQDAGAQPSDAGYVNAHGTGTPLNDAAETKTLHAIFNGGAPPVSSTKSHIGHLLGAAGAVEAVVCLEAVRLGVLPPTINLETADPECDLDYIPAGRREAPGIQMALSNSFGFGGQNACLAVAAA